MKKIKCKVCGKRFAPTADRHYMAITMQTPARIIECFDCPHCGCQNMANIRERGIQIGIDLAGDGKESMSNED